MNRQEHLLSIVAEECTEIGQRASKALRFGMTEIQEGQIYDNAERILHEVSDLLGALELAYGFRVDDMFGEMRPRINAKKEKVEKFLEYSRKIGTLTAVALVLAGCGGSKHYVDDNGRHWVMCSLDVVAIESFAPATEQLMGVTCPKPCKDRRVPTTKSLTEDIGRAPDRVVHPPDPKIEDKLP
jgi:hypothetical protein